MAIYALIGGRSIQNLTNPSLEKKILKFINKDKPNILFFPQANINDMEKSYLKFKTLMNDVFANVDVIYDLNDKNLNEKLSWADVLYFGGGHADDLIKTVKNSQLYNLLFLYDKLICGISAGAILISLSGMGDRYMYTNAYQNYNYQMVDGIGLVNVTVCPHYCHNGLWCYNDECKKYDVDGYGVEDDTAIIFKDNEIIAIKADKQKSVYKFDCKNDYRMQSLYELGDD